MLIADCIKALRRLRKPAPRSADTVLRAAVLSDAHITAAPYRRLVFIPMLRMLRRFGADVLIIAGDCTDNGNVKNWGGFTRTVLKYSREKERIVAIGNHDTWLSYDTPHDYAPARENYLKNAGLLMGAQITEVYFSRVINGVPFLTLGTEGTGVGETVSEAQLNWLAGALKTAAAEHPGSPVFVINHHPMNFTHGIGENEHGMGIEDPAVSERLKEMLNAYENVFYICGHIHFGLQTEGRFATVQRAGERVTSICLPCCEYGELFNGKYRSPGNPLPGTGLIMDIGKTGVTLRGADFLHGRENGFFYRQNIV